MDTYRRFFLPGLVGIAVCSLFAVERSTRQIGSNSSSTSFNQALPVVRSMEEGTIVAVINTPKSGTGSIEGSFIRSIPCPNPSGKWDSIPRVVFTTGCDHDMDVLRSHYVDSAATAIAHFRSSSNPNTKEERRCTIVTAIRDPHTWMPSLFMQEKAGSLCDREMSYEEFQRFYIDFLMERSALVRDTIVQVRPDLFKEFGTSLTQQMKNVEENGYSLSFNNNNNNNDNNNNAGPFQNCELLFLKMEDHDRWPDIFADLYPGVKYEPNQKRVDMCPKIADHYLQIMKHEFTTEEKVKLIGGNGDVAEYFNLYNM